MTRLRSPSTDEQWLLGALPPEASPDTAGLPSYRDVQAAHRARSELRQNFITLTNDQLDIQELFKKGWKPPVQNQEGAPGKQRGAINPQPVDDITADGKPYKAAGKLEGKSAIVTGGDSGIGRAIAILYGEWHAWCIPE